MSKHQHLKNKITTVLAVVLCEVLCPRTPDPVSRKLCSGDHQSSPPAAPRPLLTGCAALPQTGRPARPACAQGVPA